MTLFEECLDTLKNKVIPLSLEESAKIEAILQCLFPFISANINWEKVEKKIVLNSSEPEIIANLKKLLKSPLDESVYIIWDTYEPVLKTDLYSAINFFDEITSVSTRTWLLNLKQGYVIEWHWCGLKVIGLADTEKILQCNSLKRCLDVLSKLRFISIGDSRDVYRLLNRFFQPKHWSITSSYCVKSAFEIIPCIETALKKPINKDVYLLWDDKCLPILQTDIESVLTIWDTISEVIQPFQIIDTNANYLINFSLEDGTRITFNLGLK